MISIARQLKDEGFSQIILAGCSLGGNIVLKAAGELGTSATDLICGVATISPSIDLEASVRSIEKPRNRIYERYFLRILKLNIREKALLYPELYDVSRLDKIKSIRQFDDIYTAPMGGYGNADNYYRTASSINVLHRIVVPTLIIIAEDDPMVPFESFKSPALNNEAIKLIATKHGGHVGFIHQKAEGLPLFDQFWAENRVVNFCQEVMSD
jgi:predicted alpha/beta-fold hydrolase